MLKNLRNLLQDWTARQIREDFAASGRSSLIQYGDDRPQQIVGTGRAVCRHCGEKIAKGSPALQFAWDFNACGSWTATTVQIHLACNGRAEDLVGRCIVTDVDGNRCRGMAYTGDPERGLCARHKQAAEVTK